MLYYIVKIYNNIIGGVGGTTWKGRKCPLCPFGISALACSVTYPSTSVFSKFMVKMGAGLFDSFCFAGLLNSVDSIIAVKYF